MSRSAKQLLTIAFLTFVAVAVPLPSSTCFAFKSHYEPGQTIDRSPKFLGLKYRLGELLGEGLTTQIYALDDPTKAIRVIPKDEAFFRDGDGRLYPLSLYMNEFINGAKKLRQLGIPVVRTYGYARGRYVVVDRVEGPTLLQFFLRPETFSEAEKLKMLSDLVSFARKAAILAFVGDFKASSLLHDKNRGWLIVDCTGEVKANKKFDQILHTELGGFPYRSVFERMQDDPSPEEMERYLSNSPWRGFIKKLLIDANSDEKSFRRGTTKERTDFSALIQAQLAGFSDPAPCAAKVKDGLLQLQNSP